SIANQMMNSSSGAAFQALGNTKLLFIQGCINTTVTVFSILIGIFSGKTIYALALWVTISFIINFFVSYFFLIVFTFKLRFMKFIVVLISYIMIGVVLFIFGYMYSNIFIDSMYCSGFFIVFFVTFV